MSQDRRIVITGLGVVSPIGNGADEFYAALAGGAVGVRRIEAFDPSGFPCQVAGEMVGFSCREFVPKSYRKAVKIMARDIELAVAAADIAVRDAGLRTTDGEAGPANVVSERMGVNIGAGLICADLTELGQAVQFATEDGKFSLARWGREGINHLTPLWLLKYLPNMLSSHVTIIHNAQGPSNTITCADAGGLLSLGEAARIIARDAADVVLAGGAESKLNPMGLLRQAMLGRLTTTHNDSPADACRPFDRDRDGTVIGEGGAVLVLEELEHARRRGAKILAEIAGFGSASSAHSLVEPDADGRGVADAATKALTDAKMSADGIDLIAPQGLGIIAHDLGEAAGLHAVLGERAGRIPTWPIMGQLGNMGAGAGATSAAATAVALSQGRVPAAVNCPNPDPACGLSVSSEPVEGDLRAALVMNYAQGGQAAAMVLRRSD